MKKTRPAGNRMGRINGLISGMMQDLLVPHPAYHILIAVLCLVGVGLIMIFSASSIPLRNGRELQEWAFTSKQALWVLVGLGVLAFFAFFPYRSWLKLSFPFLILTFFLLLVVLLPAFKTGSNGFNRWIRFGNFGFQPSELLKLSLVVFIAAFLEKKGEKVRNLREGFLPAFSIPLFAMILVFLEPDFGTGLFIGCIAMILLIVGGIRLLYIAPCFVLALIPLSIFMVSKFDYILDRFRGFLEPMKNYHISQSLTALGSGGIFGVGLGNGRAKLHFLPEKTTDFIFSVIGEELGFLGCAFIILLYCLFAFAGIRIALRTKDTFGFFLALGITIIIALQAAMNIAVVTASVPAKGIPLPFISRGGSSLVVSAAAAGILLNISLSCRDSLQEVEGVG